MKNFSIFIILIFPTLLSNSDLSIRAKILLSIDNDQKSIYVNRVFDKTELISRVFDVPQSIVLSYLCSYTDFGQKVSESENSELVEFCLYVKRISRNKTALISHDFIQLLETDHFRHSIRMRRLLSKYKFKLLDDNFINRYNLERA